MNPMLVNYSYWFNPGKRCWEFDIREGDVLRGRILDSGTGFASRNDAAIACRKSYNKIIRSK